MVGLHAVQGRLRETFVSECLGVTLVHEGVLVGKDAVVSDEPLGEVLVLVGGSELVEDGGTNGDLVDGACQRERA